MAITRNEVTEGPSAVQGRGHLSTGADELLASWARRDALYTQRGKALSEAEVEAIIEQRKLEACYVEPRRRHEVYQAAVYWRPPLAVAGGWS
ncbi:MAG TPA: hypothetical protein VFI40_04860 [Nocardioides sp.]|nr:hypothetical protein [Nocardioides sp.]